MQIAVLDQDCSQAELACRVLSAVRHNCMVFPSTTALLNHIDHERCDLLILGGPVADANGTDILHAVRHRRAALPVLFIASHSGEDEIVTAMNAGANDCIVKPIRHSELRTRVQALLKRAYPGQEASEQTRFGPYTFDSRTSRVILADGAIELTQKEFELALLFFHHMGRPLSRAFLREAIWSGDTDIPSRTVDTHVSRIRSKLRLRPENGFRLLPVYSYGYRLEQLP